MSSAPDPGTGGHNVMTRERPDVGSYDDILAAAVRTTGLSDLGGTAHEEGLRVLVDDLASPEAGLTPRGNYFQRSEVKSALVGRLLTQAQFTARPEHAAVPIERPVFVLGLPRTGTTALHRLLHADPAAQGLEMWLTQYPQPRPPRETWEADPIFGAMQQAFAAHHVESPEYRGIHYMDATTVEECWRLLRQTGKSSSYESLANLPRYSAWLAEQDWTDAYARHRQNLQLVGLNDPDKRWVLKNPSHLTALDALMAVYPDALVVYTHRDPVVCIASSCSLSAETTAGHSTTYVGETIGRTQLDLWARAFHAFHDARPRYDQAQFVDVAFAGLLADPLGTARSVYERFGLDFTPEAQAAMAEIDRESKQGAAKPSHRYAIEDYGLTEADVRAAFDR
ncbi:sulfotransferase family protein [Nocardioides marmotae]|nr:sulfotransferase [Nocardioides marmotae]